MSVKGNSQVAQRLRKALTTTIPKRIAADAQRHYMDSFRHQGFTDRALVKWRPVKKPRTSRGKVVGGRVLKGRGLLANSIRVARADWNGIQVVAGGPHVPYARIHNEGGWIRRQVTRRAHTRRAHPARTKSGVIMRKEANVRRHQARMNLYMPKRQYMGDSTVLRNTMRQTIQRTIIETLVK